MATTCTTHAARRAQREGITIRSSTSWPWRACSTSSGRLHRGGWRAPCRRTPSSSNAPAANWTSSTRCWWRSARPARPACGGRRPQVRALLTPRPGGLPGCQVGHPHVERACARPARKTWRWYGTPWRTSSRKAAGVPRLRALLRRVPVRPDYTASVAAALDAGAERVSCATHAACSRPDHRRSPS